MGKIYNNITELIGKTPLVRLNRLEKVLGLQAEIIVKLEFFNPNQNVKERIAFSMIKGAEERGEIKPGDLIIDLSSGNTGISLAAVAAAKGYKFHAYMQDTAAKENKQILHAFGADYENLFTHPRFAPLATEYAGDAPKAMAQLLREESEKLGAYVTNQLENPDNPKAHYTTTGPEIWEDTDGKIDFFVSGAGTGGTLVGVGKYLREKNPGIKIVAYQAGPNSRPLESGNPEQPEMHGVHVIVGGPFIIPLLKGQDNLWDEVIDVEAPTGWETARVVAKHEGILVGESSGASVYTAIQLAKRPENKGKRIVAMVPDSGSHYLTTGLFALPEIK
ncbi:cysteine synthase [Fibrobacteria bacterium R8-3-H12]